MVPASQVWTFAAFLCRRQITLGFSTVGDLHKTAEKASKLHELNYTEVCILLVENRPRSHVL